MKIGLVLAISLVFLFGCAPPLMYTISDDISVTKPTYQFIDNRPAEEKQWETLSLIVSNCEYAIYRIADNQTNPNRLNYLRYRLQTELGNELKSVKVNHFFIYNNLQPYYRKSVLGQSTSTAKMVTAESAEVTHATASIAKSIVEYMTCESGKNARGGFSIMENPDAKIAVVAEIEVEINNKLFKGRKVQVTPEGGGHQETSNRMALATEDLITTLVLDYKTL